jgi:predicted nucleotidyltransferase
VGTVSVTRMSSRDSANPQHHVSYKTHMSPIRDMRFHDALSPILGSPTKLDLMRTMFTSPDRRWTGRELAAAARVSTAQAARDLAGLADTSVVTREVIGRSYSWRLNSGHVFFETLSELFHREAAARTELLRTLANGLSKSPVESARIFGSIAKGEEREDSDVDLFLAVRTASEREKAEEALHRLRTQVWIRFGNPLSALVYTRAELARPRNPALLKAIELEGLNVAVGAA